MKQCFSLLQVQEHATLPILSQINPAYTHPVTFISLTYELVLPRTFYLLFFLRLTYVFFMSYLLSERDKCMTSYTSFI